MTKSTNSARRYALRPQQRVYFVIKSILDRVISAVALMILAIPMLLVALAIRITDPGPVFFRQKRIGRDQRTFTILKFRTMRMSTPHDTPTHLLPDPQSYITPLGRFLRKTSLDELPQLLNILAGQMSIVGPRPALWNQDDLIRERETYGVHQVLPGLTGWAQIHGRDELEIPEKARLDGEYIEKFGFFMDIRCFFGTFGILSGKGVVEGGTGQLDRERRDG